MNELRLGAVGLDLTGLVAGHPSSFRLEMETTSTPTAATLTVPASEPDLAATVTVTATVAAGVVTFDLAVLTTALQDIRRPVRLAYLLVADGDPWLKGLVDVAPDSDGYAHQTPSTITAPITVGSTALPVTVLAGGVAGPPGVVDMGAVEDLITTSILDHAEDAAPHPAYDLDLPDLVVLFNNQLI